MIGRKNNTVLYVIILVLAAVLVATPFYFKKNLSIGDYISAVWRIPQLLEENQSLRLQIEDKNNEILRFAQNDEEGEIAALATLARNDVISAKVYSLYPFNTKNRIYIGSGAEEGVTKGKAVLISDTVFVGIVEKVSENRSEIITLYDTSFALPVRVGMQETDALLQGGIAPRLTLIDKS